MPIPFSEADFIFKSEKRLLPPLKWREICNNKKAGVRLSVVSRIGIDRSIPRGIYFRAISYPGSLTRITFQLDFEVIGIRTQPPLYRFELNPIKPHTNLFDAPKDIAGVYIDAGVPHEHVFYDNLKKNGELRSRPDANGRIVENPPKDFTTAWEHVCSRINIVNGGDLPPPSNQGRLL